MGDKDKERDWLKSFKPIFNLILKAEKGTTGRVNLTFSVAVVLVGAIWGQLFTLYGATVVALCICSAIVNQYIPRRRR